MFFVEKIIRGDCYRKSRFHDMSGHLVDLSGFRNLPRALLTATMRLGFDFWPELPWISYNAISLLNRLIQKDWKVLEFGSGMSTIWLAKRCAFVYSIEHDHVFYEKICEKLEDKRIRNVRYELRTRDHYYDLSEVKDASLDLVFIDGVYRKDCVCACFSKIRKGAYIYLDNSDSERDARDILLREVDKRKGQTRIFVDFAPTQIHVNEGILACL